MSIIKGNRVILAGNFNSMKTLSLTMLKSFSNSSMHRGSKTSGPGRTTKTGSLKGKA
jgi:hypothetical protein